MSNHMLLNLDMLMKKNVMLATLSTLGLFIVDLQINNIYIIVVNIFVASVIIASTTLTTRYNPLVRVVRHFTTLIFLAAMTFFLSSYIKILLSVYFTPLYNAFQLTDINVNILIILTLSFILSAIYPYAISASEVSFLEFNHTLIRTKKDFFFSTLFNATILISFYLLQNVKYEYVQMYTVIIISKSFLTVLAGLFYSSLIETFKHSSLTTNN